MEGTDCFQATSCNPRGLRFPALVYPTRSVGCAVLGGYVYRGSALAELAGNYFYSDVCTGWVRSLVYSGSTATALTQWIDETGPMLSLGEDAAGELYFLARSGVVYRLVRG
jgi:hypothetical protein